MRSYAGWTLFGEVSSIFYLKLLHSHSDFEVFAYNLVTNDILANTSNMLIVVLVIKLHNTHFICSIYLFNFLSPSSQTVLDVY